MTTVCAVCHAPDCYSELIARLFGVPLGMIHPSPDGERAPRTGSEVQS